MNYVILLWEPDGTTPASNFEHHSQVPLAIGDSLMDRPGRHYRVASIVHDLREDKTYVGAVRR